MYDLILKLILISALAQSGLRLSEVAFCHSHECPIWKDRYLDEITSSDVHKVVFEHIGNVSSYSRHTSLKIVRRAFSMAVEDGILLRNPAAGIKVKLCDANQSVLNKRTRCPPSRG